MSKYYTVYLRKTDEVIASGTSKECARILKKSVNGFHSMVSKNLKGKQNKYDVIVEEDNDLEEEEAEE